MTLKRTQEAFSQLEDQLHLSLGGADVWRVDTAFNMEMTQPVAAYLSRLMRCQYLRRVRLDETTLRYENKQRQLFFYDKPKQVQNRSQPWSASTPVLRYERRLMKNLKRQLKQRITVADLQASSTYNRLLESWQQDYYRIDKMRESYVPDTVSTVRELRHVTEQMGLRCNGVEELLALYDRSVAAGTLTRSRKRSARAHLHKLATSPATTYTSEAVLELDQKVGEIVETYRA